MLVVGATSRDVVGDDPRGWRLGGPATYGALTLARLGLRVRALLGVDDAAAGAPEVDLLRSAGADVVLARLGHGPVFVNDERPDGRVQTALDVPDPISTAALPPDWEASDAVLLAPVADELPDAWADVPAPGSLVGLGWQGLLRSVRPDGRVVRRPPTASALLRRAGIVGLSRTDVDPALPIAELEGHLAPGATLVLTDAERGGFLVVPGQPGGRRRWRVYSAIAPDAVVDPTGAGDVFLATLLAAMVDQRRLGGPRGGSMALRLAAAAGSLCVEAPGLFGVPDLESVLRRTTRGRAA